ncbi:hypothetical protein ABVG11_02295 [Streptomyces sp. HD1123-B1]|uniref:hypothetical protein n=1 Tax=Streptomyces huangiella TaxID=3228804 RepID=UPI003D7DCA34
MSRVRLAVTACAVIAVVVTGCGSSDVNGSPEKHPSESHGAAKDKERDQKRQPSAAPSGGSTSDTDDGRPDGGAPTGKARESKLPPELDTDTTIKTLRTKWERCQKRSGYTQPAADSDGKVVIKDTPELRASERACKAERKALDQRVAEIMAKSKQ